MLRRAGHLLRVVALGTLAVPACALKFNITAVQQCEPVVISFFGSNITKPPTFLSIIPLDSNAIVVPLQNPALISTGISLSFLPLAAGSNFLASLDDDSGENLISISDVIRVLPSPTGNSSCLPKPDADSPRHFTVADTVSQCEDFTVTYDTTAVSKAPSVRLYSPRGPSFLLNNTLDDPGVGLAKYTMNFTRGSEVVLLVDDGATIRETTSLLTVGGDSSSSTSCIRSKGNNNTTSATSAASTGNDTPLASKAVLIGAITGGVAIFLVAVGMILFVIRDRRRRRTIKSIQFNPSAMEKAADKDNNNNENGSPANMDVILRPPRPAPTATGMVSNPIYTTNSFLSVEKINNNKVRGSWTRMAPEGQQYPGSIMSRSLTAISPTAHTTELDSSNIVVIPPETPQRPDRTSLESLDIEGMLNMASLQSENNPSRKNSDVTPIGPMFRTPSLTAPTLTYVRALTSSRHLRDPSDVPGGPDSMLFSTYSGNPFDNHDASAFQEPLRTGDSMRSPGGVGLPRSPRPQDRTKMFSGASGRSSSDWYGIAR